MDNAKMGVFAGSLAAGVLGATILAVVGREPAAEAVEGSRGAG